ncbi:hypothetical protein [Mesorhizobium sp.]|uniref:hypothetical protein n=1 Tax=Mesorhizobium sp. TaxID=1871066 RepID=UPI000FE76BF3|nr:hypothetical protein [Mesorhizobium sp.]RWB59619.1 MAG: hypothetical protein EOQ47_04845 [Mesorhizobium sp.]
MDIPPPNSWLSLRFLRAGMPDVTQATPALVLSKVMAGCRPRRARAAAADSGFSMSGIAPPRALAYALPAFPHALEKFDMRQELKWCAVHFDVLRYSEGRVIQR